jgi:ubiquinone/menaquinone biosynthesis C-methylase UbiE
MSSAGRSGVLRFLSSCRRSFRTNDSAVVKEAGELRYWQGKLAQEGSLTNDHYEQFFTHYLGLRLEDYYGKTILDIGCGPRGSLEWASMAGRRVGLDPLADSYRALGTEGHAMTYVCAEAEAMPFPDDAFDVVSSFNSLDHVNDLDLAVGEIIRVLKPGGLLLLLTDVDHAPTLLEPILYSWDVVDQFHPQLELVEERRYERSERGMYQSIREAVPYDAGNSTPRYGVLLAKFVKR